MEKEKAKPTVTEGNVTKVVAPPIEKTESPEGNVTKVDITPPAEEPPKPPEEPVADITLPTEVDIAVPIATAPVNQNLPEGVTKLMSFMKETGGSVMDYARLNRDVAKIGDTEALGEYYKTTKTHLDADEIKFLMDDKFSFDADLDDENDIRRKKLAFKEAVADAKTYLVDQKARYYEDIKATSSLTSEQQKAVDFFNRYEKDSEDNRQLAVGRKNKFLEKTNEVFNDSFKGFEYNIGDKKMDFTVSDTDMVKTTQSDINNFVKKFLNDNNEMTDAAGYHKSLFTAMNPDQVAKHFYEQGRADAISDSVASAKNVDMSPRGVHGNVKVEGTSYRVIDGDDTASFKVKLNK